MRGSTVVEASIFPVSLDLAVCLKVLPELSKKQIFAPLCRWTLSLSLARA